MARHHPVAHRRKQTLLSIPVHIDRSWFMVLAFVTWSLASDYFPSIMPGVENAVYWMTGLVSAILLFACVLLHEFGHSLMAMRYGMTIDRVTLFMFGGVAQLVGQLRRPSMELVVALAGPLVSAVIAGGCAITAFILSRSHVPPIVVIAVVQYLAFMNVALIIFNLLPGFPLDGGRVLRALLWLWTGNLRRATRIASIVGIILAFGLFGLGGWLMGKGPWAGGLWYVLLGFFLYRSAHASYQATS